VWCVQLPALLAEMESRAARKEYQQLLADCHALYCEQRLALVSTHAPGGGAKLGNRDCILRGVCCLLHPVAGSACAASPLPCLWRRGARSLMSCLPVFRQVAGVVQQRITDYAKTQNLPSLTRSGCAYLMQVRHACLPQDRLDGLDAL
jgi:hypothetical protein